MASNGWPAGAALLEKAGKLRPSSFFIFDRMSTAPAREDFDRMSTASALDEGREPEAVSEDICKGDLALFLLEGDVEISGSTLFLFEGDVAISSSTLFLFEGDVAVSGSTAGVLHTLPCRTAK